MYQRQAKALDLLERALTLMDEADNPLIAARIAHAIDDLRNAMPLRQGPLH